MAARNAERQNLARQLTERRAALDAIDLDALEIRDEVLRAQSRKSWGSAAMRSSGAMWRGGAETCGHAEAAMAARQRDEAASKLKIAEQVHTRKTDERAETAQMADLAEATLSEHASKPADASRRGRSMSGLRRGRTSLRCRKLGRGQAVARGASAPLRNRCGSEGGRGRYFRCQCGSDEGDQRVRNGEERRRRKRPRRLRRRRRFRHCCPRWRASSRDCD